MARSVLHIIDHTESFALSCILLFREFEKAFHSIELDFLYQSLEVFNFGATLIRWIKTFCNNVSSCVIKNESFSEPFKLESGISCGNSNIGYISLDKRTY